MRYVKMYMCIFCYNILKQFYLYKKMFVAMTKNTFCFFIII